MATLANLRQNYLNLHMKRLDGATLPWTDVECDMALASAIKQLWPKNGRFVTGDTLTSSDSHLLTVPDELGTALGDYRISRIDLLSTDGDIIDRISNWRYYSATQVVVQPKLISGITARFSGWAPFEADGSDLPVRLETTVAYRAAAILYGDLVGRLVNSELQQGLDAGRAVDYNAAVGASAYWQRMYLDEVIDDPSRVSYAPRYGYR